MAKRGTNPTVRMATAADIPDIRKLIEASARGLQRGEYSAEQIEVALGTVFGVDTTLISDGTYYVAEVAEREGGTRLVGCGGWSKRKTLYGSDHGPYREDTLLDPKQDAAKIRAFFVHPDWARRGIGTSILEICEATAREAGFSRFEMGATLTGVPLYLARGYASVERIEVPLADGSFLPVVRMTKIER